MGNETKGIVPWGLHPLKPWIVKELNNRAKEYGMNPKAGGGKPYSGPRTAWTRVFSNGISKRPVAKDLDGFVLGGVFDFNNSLGFTGDKQAAIGVDAYGRYHKIDQTGLDVVPNGDFGIRPPPSVTSVECELFGSQNASFPSLCRKVKVNWKCYNLAQLNYLIPYFLTPRITLVVEWGWNNYDEISLVDLTDRQWIASMFTDPSYTLDFLETSNGNYDAATGFITDFGYSLNEQGGYDCYTTITNTNFLIEGQSYHNQSVTNKESVDAKPKPKKTFKEFVRDDLKNINSLNVKDGVGGARILKELGIETKNLSHKVFDAGKETGNTKANEEKMKWIRMDLLVDIINAFSSVVMVDTNDEPKVAKETENGQGEGTDKPVRLNNLNIDGIRISAHPALKSVNKNVLFPNELAPRLCTLGEFKRNSGGNDIRSAKVEGGEYSALFKTVDKIVSQGNMDRSYDDLKSLINPNGDSFPMFKDFPDKELGNLKSGYWGYLSDVFVSVEMVQDLVRGNDTILKLVESLLQNISQAMCNVSQLKLTSSEYGNKYYSVNDSNLSYINTDKDASRLMRISVGAINSAFIKSAGFDVKISAEMMNQLVAQSANEVATLSGNNSKLGVMNNDPKRIRPNRFSGGDRLFAYGALPNTTDSNQTTEPATTTTQKIAELKRMFTDDNDGFYIYSSGKGAESKRYILAETDATFMTQLLTGEYDEKATYQNNAIMPGTEFRFDILGISGITYLSQFTLDHVPDTYNYQNAVWQVSDIKHKVENKMWVTSITAQVRPLTILGS